MKVIQEALVNPVHLILETQEEIDKIFTLLNHIDIVKTLELDECWELLTPYRSKGYLKEHNKLNDIIRR